MDQAVCEYGSWDSPITIDLITGESVSLSDFATEGKVLVWVEGRPKEKGRCVLTSSDGDLTPPPFNVRAHVHEYGGGAFLLSKGRLFIVSDHDQEIYEVAEEEMIQRTDSEKLRFADFSYDSQRDALFSVREDHRNEGEVLNTIVSISLKEKGEGEVIVEGADFYSCPRISKNGDRLSWLCWNHPDMPWDNTELWVGKIDKQGKIGEKRKIAGGNGESIFQPQWGEDGALYFVSDRTGWWNLYRYDGEIEPLCPKEAEFGLPSWIFGMRTYAFAQKGDKQLIAATFREKGREYIGLIHLESKNFEVLDLPFTAISQIAANGNHIFFFGAGETTPKSLIRIDLNDLSSQVVASSQSVELDSEVISKGEFIEFPTKEEKKAYGIFYPPVNPRFSAPEGEKPPLIVRCHGGPTAHVSSSLNLQVQYWTSRGFAFFDVDYGGSTGYGREYRERLNGNWGIVDINDTICGCEYLIAEGLVDPKRCIIKGGSAGGYTVLASLAFRDFFCAGISCYGVSDLELLAMETHKFESHYEEKLVAPYPEQIEVYRERSPVHHVDKIQVPLLLLQGEKDKVVLPNQAEKVFSALRKNKIPVSLLLFPEEGHGFRSADAQKRALQAEYEFLSRILDLPTQLEEKIEIHNLN